MSANPFTLSFGKEPTSMIKRDIQSYEIIDGFSADNPGSHVYMITGVRGAGKTVMLTEIASHFRKEENWIVVDLNPERDLLKTLAAELSNRKELMQIFRDAKINLSFLGLGIEIDGEPPVTDMVVALRRMLQKLTNLGKRVLVTIDEAVSSETVREFASQFQIFIREELNVFLLMTGLYDNVYELQNEKTLTFLYRAPKIVLKPLNISLIARKYAEVFELDDENAVQMAKMTMGYSFAFQVLGYLCWQQKQPWQAVIPEYDAYLEEYVYEKIWSELSDTDKKIVISMHEGKSAKVADIRKKINMDSNKFNIYRNRLIRKGILAATGYGELSFVLPRFREFVDRYYAE